MRKIAIIGASREDKLFFQHAFKGNNLDLTFYPNPVKTGVIDPATEILSVFVDTVISRELITALPKLALIACRATGFNNIDIAAAKKNGIAITNVPAYGSTTVAEYAFTLLLMLTRHMPTVLRESGTAHPNREAERGIDLFGKTIGIIGTGSIGLGVARIARGFGMKVIGYDVYPRPEEAAKIGFNYVDNVDMLLKASDVITLHVPYTPENHHFLSRARLGKLRHGSIVINTARGELVDTPALVDALNHGHVRAAALDVMEDEYLLDPEAITQLAAQGGEVSKQTLQHAVALTALQRMPNVIVTNHNAYNTTEAIERINQITADNIMHFINGTPSNIVT